MSPTPFNLPLNAKIVAKHGTTSVYSLKDGRLAFVDYEKQRMFLDGSRNFGSEIYGSGHNSSWADERLASVARKGGSDALIRVKAVKPKQSAMPPSESGYEEEEIPDTNFTRAMRFIPQAFLNWAKTYKPGDQLPIIPPGYGDKRLCDRSVSNDSYSQSGVTVDDVVKETLSAMGFPDINPDLAFAPEPETKSMPKFEQKGILGREIRDMAHNIADSILSARGLWRDELNKIRCGSGPNANRFTDIFGTGCDVPGADMAGNIVGMIRSGDEIPGPVDDVAGKLEGAREQISDGINGTETPGERGSLRDFLSAKLTGVRGGHTPHIEGDSPMTDFDPAAGMGTATPARPSERWKFMGLRSLVNRNKARERKKKMEESAAKAKREYSEFLSSDDYRRWEADFVRTRGRLPNAGEKIHQYALHLGYESPVEGGTFMGLADTSSTDASKTHHEAMVDEILNDSRLWPFGIGYESDRKIAAKRKEIEDNLEEYYLMTLHSAYNAGGPKQIEVVRPDGTKEMVDNPEHKERFISAVPGYFRIKQPGDPMSSNHLADAIAVTSVNNFWSGDGGPDVVGFVGSSGARFDPRTGLPITPTTTSAGFPRPTPGTGELTPGPVSSVDRGSAPLWARGTNTPFQFTITLDPMWFGSRDYQNQKIKGFGMNHLGMELSRESFLMHTADHELNHVDDFSWRLGQKLGFESQSEWMDRLRLQKFIPSSRSWENVIDLRKDAKYGTYLHDQIKELDAVLNRPGVSDWEKMDALWEFYLRNINFNSEVESKYARWLSGDYRRGAGGARLSKEAIAQKLQEIRDNLLARGYGEETGVPQMNFWRDMIDTLTGVWNPTTRTFEGTKPLNIVSLLIGDRRMDPSGVIPGGQARLDNMASNLLAGFIGGTYSGESDWEFAAELRTHLNKRGALQDIREFLADSDRNIHNLDESDFMTLVAKYVGEEEVYRLYGETAPPNRFAPFHRDPGGPGGGGGGGGGGGTPPGGGGGGGAIRPATPLGPGPGVTPPTPPGGGPTPPPATPGGRTPRLRGSAVDRPTIPMVPRADEPPAPSTPPPSEPAPGNLRGRGVRPVIDIGRPGTEVSEPEPGIPGTGVDEPDVDTGRLRGPGVRRPARPTRDEELVEPTVRGETEADRVSPERRRADAERRRRTAEMFEYSDDEMDERDRTTLRDDLLGRRERIKKELDGLNAGRKTRDDYDRIEELEAQDDEIGDQLIELQMPNWREARARGEAERADRRRRTEKAPGSAREDGTRSRPSTTVSEARDSLNGARERARDRRFAERQEAEKRAEEASRRMAEAREADARANPNADRIRLNQIREQRVDAVARVAEAERRHDDALRRARSTGSDPDRGGDGDSAAWAEYRAAYEELNDADAANANLLRESRELEDRVSRGDTGSSSGERDTLELAAEQRKQNILARRRNPDSNTLRMAKEIDDQIAARRNAIERARTATDPKERRGQQILATAYEIKLMEGNGDLDFQSERLQLDVLSDLADLNGTPLYYGDDGLYRLESSVTEWQRTERIGEIDQSPDAIAARRAIADRIFGESDSSDLLGSATSQPTNLGRARPRTMKMFNQTTGEIVYVDATDNDVIRRLRGEGFAPDARRGTGSAPSAPSRTTRRPSQPRRGGRRIRMVNDSGNVIFISADDGDGYYDAKKDGYRESRGPEAGMGSGGRRDSEDPRFAIDTEDDGNLLGLLGSDRRSGEREDRKFGRRRRVDELADYLAEGDGAFMTPEQAYLQRDGAIARRETARNRMERLIRERDGIENGVIGADLTDEQAERRVARLNEQIDDLAGEIAEMDKTAELYDSHARNLESRTPTTEGIPGINEGPKAGGGRNIRGPRSAFGDDEPSAGMGQTYDRFLGVHANVVDRKRNEIEEAKKVLQVSERSDARMVTHEEAGRIASTIENLFSGDMRIDRNLERSLTTEMVSNGRSKIAINAFVDPNLVSVGQDGSLRVPVSMQITSPDGKVTYGNATRYIEVGDNGINVEHGSLTIRDDYRGKGIASEFNARNENLYRAIGARSITTSGSSSSGPDSNNPMGSIIYGTGATHWARNGFTWRDDEAKDRFISVIDDAIRNKPGIFTPEERQRIGSLYRRGRNGKFQTDATAEELVDFEEADRLFAEEGVTIPYRRDLEPLGPDQPSASRLTRIADRLGRRRSRNEVSEPISREWNPQADMDAARGARVGGATTTETVPDWIRNWDPEGEISSGRSGRGVGDVFDEGPEAGMSGGGTNRPMVSTDREGRPLTSVASPRRNGTVDENHEANLRAAEDDVELVKSEIGALEAALAEAKTTGEWRGADFGVHFGDEEPNRTPQRAYLTRTNGGVVAPVNLSAEETKQKDAIGKAERRIDSAKKELVRLQRVAVDKRARRDQNVLDLEDIPEGELEQLVAEAESIKQSVKLRDEARQKLMQDSRFSDLDWEQRVAAVDEELERMGMPDPLSPGRGERAAIHVGADTLEGGVLDPSYTAGDESMMTGGGNTGMLNQSQIRNVRRQRDELAETLKAAERLVEQLETGTTKITPSNKAEADLLNGLTNSNKFSAGEALDLSKANSRVDAATLSQRIRELLAAKMERDRVSLAQQDRILKRVDESPKFGYVSAYPLRAEGTVTEGYFGRNSGKKVPANIGTFLTEVEGRSSGRATPDGFVNVKDRPMLDRWKNTLRGTQWLAIGGDDTIVRGFGNSPGDEAQIMGVNTPVFGFSFGVSEAANYRTLLGDIGMALAARAVDLRRRGEEVTPESVMKARKQVENSRIIMLARNGSTIEEIAEKTGRSRQFVSELLRLAGVTNPYTEGF